MATEPDPICESMDPGRSIGLSIPSRMEMLSVLDRLVEAIAEQMEFDEDATIELATSLIEAGTNAIQHGHNHDQSKMVCFHFLLGEGTLDIWVRDQGPGFDVARVLQADPTRSDALLNFRGRGIYIMRQMMDQVDFEILPGKGTLVHLTKSKRGSNGSRP